MLFSNLLFITAPLHKSFQSLHAKNTLLPDYQGVSENSARNVLDNMQLTSVSCPDYISTAPVITNYVQFPLQASIPKAPKPPIVLIHGFDSSCMEFRRLLPLLATYYPVIGVDILGWGFNNHTGINTFSPEAKLQHLKCFLEQHVAQPCILVGASLGGGIAFSLAAKYPALVKKVVLIDAQGFIDGKGPSPFPPSFFKLGVAILKSEWLRQLANKLSYKDESFATKEAMVIGRLHCLLEGWERAACDFTHSGGFILSDKITQVTQETLILWGRDDKILEPANAFKFEQLLPRNKLVWIEDCGHVPHLEKPSETAAAILEFIRE